MTETGWPRTLDHHWTGTSTLVPCALQPLEGVYLVDDEVIQVTSTGVAIGGRMFSRVNRGLLGSIPVDHEAGAVLRPGFGVHDKFTPDADACARIAALSAAYHAAHDPVRRVGRRRGEWP